MHTTSDRRIVILMVAALILSAVCAAVGGLIQSRRWDRPFVPVEPTPGQPAHVKPVTVNGEHHA